MATIGIVEGFFGPAWSVQARLHYADFLSKFENSFYFYAPKRDPHLRKEWRGYWSESYLRSLSTLIESFHKQGVQFGVGLSPFGLGKTFTLEDQHLLEDKLQQLKDLGIDRLGLFFDDMPSSEDLASVQIEVVKKALALFPKGLMFCPSYYTYDPILDKVFGPRPAGYLEELARGIPASVSLLWTGPRVISEEIRHEHLKEVTKLLKRKPFIWENIFANDGPRNCKFLKLKYFSGRDKDFLKDCEGVAFNLMNQPHLSQILFEASWLVLNEGLSGEAAFKKALLSLGDSDVARFIQTHREALLNEGLDKFDEEKKSALLKELASSTHPVAWEIKDWLNGVYLVGAECLTD